MLPKLLVYISYLKLKLTAMQKLNQRLVFFRVLPVLLTFLFSLADVGSSGTAKTN